MNCRELHDEGLRAFEVGDFESAARLFWSGLQLEESGELWNDWATARLQLGERSIAEQGFRRALDLDCGLPEAAINLGILLAGTNRYDEAINYLDRGKQAARADCAQVEELLQWCRQQSGAAQSRLEAGNKPAQERKTFSTKLVMFPAPMAAQVAGVKSAVPAGELTVPVRGPQAVPAPRTEAPAQVVFEGIVYGGSGYADETVAVLTGLCERGVRIRLESPNQREDSEAILTKAVNKTLDEMKHTSVEFARSIYLHSAPAHDFHPGIYARCRVGRTMFETDRIPDSWVDRCAMMDELWVPSEFNRRTFQDSGVDGRKIQVMHAGVDTGLFRPGLEPFPLPIKNQFKFLSVFEWTARKAPDILLRAFLREFRSDEGVALVLRTYARPDATVDLVPRIAQFIEHDAGLRIEKAPPIVLVSGFMKSADMPRLYNAADAFVLPSRGEGYGRPYMEALSCGLPVIATAWSGQTDFLTAENSFPVEIEGLVPVPDSTEIDTYFGHCWAQPSVEDLQRQMRFVYSHQQEARQRAERGREQMVSSWDWSAVLPRWQQRIMEILA